MGKYKYSPVKPLVRKSRDRWWAASSTPWQVCPPIDRLDEAPEGEHFTAWEEAMKHAVERWYP